MTTTTGTTVSAEPRSHAMTITREFDAPRELVFRAFTDPRAIPQWWGPAAYDTTVDMLEPRHGGCWRYIQRGDDGTVHTFRGVFHDVTSPERLIYTFEYEPMPGHVALESVHLQERGGRTLVTNTAVFPTIEERDGMLSSGAESGARESMERLSAYLEAQS